MASKKATYKDIAEILGVSTTTVHRALTGKSGVGVKMTAKIKKLAEEMEYESSHPTSAFKREELRFAIVFPEATMENRYYYLSLWNGVRSFFKGLTPFSVTPVEFSYPLLPDSNGRILKEIYETQKEHINGLITIAVDHPQSSYFLEKFSSEEIPVVAIGADLHRNQALCSVMSHDEMVGRMAAELLTAFPPSGFSGKIIITGNPVGNFAMPDQYYNVSGFERYAAQHAKGFSILTAYSSDSAAAGSQIRNYLKKYNDIYAIYSTSARHTVLICEIAEELHLSGKLKLIGNDFFPESRDYLEKGTLTAIMDKKIQLQSYEAAKILFNYVLRKEYPKSPVLKIEPDILLRSSVF